MCEETHEISKTINDTKNVVDETDVVDVVDETQNVPVNDPYVNPLLKIDKMVLSGGGLRGCIHIGVMKFLEEKNIMKNISCIAGTSIGSLVATLISMSYTSAELSQIIKTFNYLHFQSIDVCNIMKNYGVDTFEKIMGFITTLFVKKNFMPYITFLDLHKQTNKHLIINAVCLNSHENTFFDYQLTPNMPVIVAIRASMSLPVIFGSVNYNGLTYVDGGLLNNFPINFPLFTECPETVLGVNLNNPMNHSVKDINTIDSYAIHLCSCLYDAYNNLIDYSKSKIHIITVPTPKFTTFDLLLSDDDKQYLINLGYYKTIEYFEKMNTPEVENKEPTFNISEYVSQIKGFLSKEQYSDAKNHVDVLIGKLNHQPKSQI